MQLVADPDDDFDMTRAERARKLRFCESMVLVLRLLPLMAMFMPCDVGKREEDRNTDVTAIP